jgi:hypothetical protein
MPPAAVDAKRFATLVSVWMAVGRVGCLMYCVRMGAPPWKLLAPFVPGAPLGDGWVIESLSTVSHGSATLVLQHSRKGEARISVCPNVGAPRGIAHTEHLTSC